MKGSKKMKKNFITGFVSGAVAFSMIGAFAANMICYALRHTFET